MLHEMSAGSCMAVHMTYVAGSSVPDSGTLNSIMVSDVTFGIKDPSIFTPPKSCFVVNGEAKGGRSKLSVSNNDTMAQYGRTMQEMVVSKGTVNDKKIHSLGKSGVFRIARKLSLSLPFFSR